jgi:trigger factor
MEAFRQEVRANMESEAAKGCRSRVRDTILDKLYEHNQFEVPKVMLDAEVNRLREEMLEKIKSQGMDASMLDKVEASHFEDQAKKRVSLQLILSEIIRSNNMKADPNKVRGIIETQARNYEDPGAIINWYYADKSRLAEVEALALEGDVIDWILGKCKVRDVEMSFDEIMNTGQTGTA